MHARQLNRAAAVLLTAAVVGAGLAGAARAGDKLPGAATISKEEFDRVRGLVKPSAKEEVWAQVKWVTTLWEAHEKAVKEGNPIVVFTVGGEPLGIC